jgi:hypothetical protein
MVIFLHNRLDYFRFWLLIYIGIAVSVTTITIMVVGLINICVELATREKGDTLSNIWLFSGMGAVLVNVVVIMLRRILSKSKERQTPGSDT